MSSNTFVSLVLAMALVVVVSNVLVQFLFGDWLTWAAFTYPIAFLITDLANRLLGPAAARKIVFYGFIVGVLCSLLASQLETADGVPYTTLRIALGSGLAFLIAQLTDVYVFSRLRHASWWKAPALSSVAGSVIDTAIFFTVAFSAAFIFLEPTNDVSWATELIPLLGVGPVVPLWVSLATADFGVKLLLVALALLPFKLLVSHFSRSND